MRVDFYVLEQMTRQKALFYMCHLLEKAYENQQPCFIHTENLESAEYLDTLLWTYKEDSFLAHQIYKATELFPPLIQIGYANAPAEGTLLFNLAKTIPPFYNRFQQIVEIVYDDPNVQQEARERYKLYRDQGLELQTHKIKGAP